MYSDWTKHIRDQKDREDFVRDVRGSKRILDHLKGLLVEKERALDRSEMDPKVFDQPNWSHNQAYKNGYRAALTYLITLTDLDQQNKE